MGKEARRYYQQLVEEEAARTGKTVEQIKREDLERAQPRLEAYRDQMTWLKVRRYLENAPLVYPVNGFGKPEEAITPSTESPLPSEQDGADS